jgi:hypothetical protein
LGIILSIKRKTMPMMEKSTYLARVRSDVYDGQFERFQVRREVHLITIDSGLSGMSQRTATLNDISIGGAGLSVSLIHGLPKHYYLKIIGVPNRIGCAEAFRSGNRVGVKFIAHLDEELVRSIIRTDFRSGG